MASSKVRMYHNPRCTKSRETLALLRENGVEPEIVEYLKAPPSAAEVVELIGKLKLDPHALLRTKEEPYKRLKLSPKSSKAEIATAIATDPVLLERPIVVVGKRAAIGRPPENVLSILPK
ncbi:MAG TPA: arsenate reductase (glutaredoxin) [Polyangiales bacterium]|nr:arsenate reductase (glutaredoxin) [Polyangiales bacterium]